MRSRDDELARETGRIRQETDRMIALSQTERQQSEHLITVHISACASAYAVAGHVNPHADESWRDLVGAVGFEPTTR